MYFFVYHAMTVSNNTQNIKLKSNFHPNSSETIKKTMIVTSHQPPMDWKEVFSQRSLMDGKGHKELWEKLGVDKNGVSG